MAKNAFITSFVILSTILKIAHMRNEIRYVRIDAPSNFLQISQIAVFDSINMLNIAFKKRSYCSSAFTGDLCSYSCSNAVDGSLTVKNFKNCSNLAYRSSDKHNTYWFVDLGASYSVWKIVYYGRGDGDMETSNCSIGHIISAQDSSFKTLHEWLIVKSDFIQTFTILNNSMVGSMKKISDNSNSYCKVKKMGFNDVLRIESSACYDHLVNSYQLDRFYSSNASIDRKQCDPTDHHLPVLKRIHFLKSCEFSGNVSIIYFIVAHKHPKMLNRLLTRLSEDASSLLLVHIDELAHESFSNEVKRMVLQESNRCLVRYGTIVYLTASIVDVMTAAFKWALKANTKWSHMITLTGQDYPLFHPHTIRERIQEIGNKTWFTDLTTCMKAEKFGCVQYPGEHSHFWRMTTFGFPCANESSKVAITLPRHPWIFSNPAKYKLDYFCKTFPMTTAVWARRTVHFLTHDSVAIASYAFFHRSYRAVEEHFWPSLLWSKARDHLHVQTPCLMSWRRGVGEDGTRESIDYIHNTFLTMDEKDFILSARKYWSLFARKFAMEVDAEVLDYIDALAG